jgi:hypothetical protein
MTLDTTVAFDNIVVFVIPLVALLTSSPVMWRKGHLLNFSVLQRVHSYLVYLFFSLYLSFLIYSIVFPFIVSVILLFFCSFGGLYFFFEFIFLRHVVGY